MKQKEFGLNFKDIIVDSLTKAKELQEKISEPFYTSDYPDINDSFIEALNEALFVKDNKGIFIAKESIEFVLEDDTLHIDGDGFPYIIYSIKIKDIDLVICVEVYHHNSWDFYLK